MDSLGAFVLELPETNRGLVLYNFAVDFVRFTVVSLVEADVCCWPYIGLSKARSKLSIEPAIDWPSYTSCSSSLLLYRTPPNVFVNDLDGKLKKNNLIL